MSNARGRGCVDAELWRLSVNACPISSLRTAAAEKPLAIARAFALWVAPLVVCQCRLSGKHRARLPIASPPNHFLLAMYACVAADRSGRSAPLPISVGPPFSRSTARLPVIDLISLITPDAHCSVQCKPVCSAAHGGADTESSRSLVVVGGKDR